MRFQTPYIHNMQPSRSLLMLGGRTPFLASALSASIQWRVLAQTFCHGAILGMAPFGIAFGDIASKPAHTPKGCGIPLPSSARRKAPAEKLGCVKKPWLPAVLCTHNLAQAHPVPCAQHANTESHACPEYNGTVHWGANWRDQPRCRCAVCRVLPNPFHLFGRRLITCETKAFRFFGCGVGGGPG